MPDCGMSLTSVLTTTDKHLVDQQIETTPVHGWMGGVAEVCHDAHHVGVPPQDSLAKTRAAEARVKAACVRVWACAPLVRAQVERIQCLGAGNDVVLDERERLVPGPQIRQQPPVGLIVRADPLGTPLPVGAGERVSALLMQLSERDEDHSAAGAALLRARGAFFATSAGATAAGVGAETGATGAVAPSAPASTAASAPWF